MILLLTNMIFMQDPTITHWQAWTYNVRSYDIILTSLLRSCESITFDILYLRNKFDFGLFMELWTLRVSCKVGFSLTLQETQSTHDSINRPTVEFITYILY